MFGDGALTFREFVMGEPVPLAAIQGAVLEFLRGRDDVALFGAQAVNAYVAETRMTEDVDVMASDAESVAEQLRSFLAERFGIAVRVRAVAGGRGHRVFQATKQGGRHLVDVRSVAALPRVRVLDGIPVVEPAELVASKVVAATRRRGTLKSWTDRRDAAALLLAFPDLKRVEGSVRDALVARGAAADALALWSQIAAEPIAREDEDAEFEP